MAMRADSLRPASVTWKVAGLVLMLNQKTRSLFSVAVSCRLVRRPFSPLNLSASKASS